MSKYIAFDIGGTFIKYGVVDDSGKILKKGKISTPQTEKPFLESLSEKVKVVQKEYQNILGIGISVPGTPNSKGVMVNFGSLTQMYGLALKEKLNNLTQLPVVVENDANAAAIAEKWIGAGKKYSNYMVMVLGTGIGGGIVINNQIYRGGHGIAGEFGWVLNHGINKVGELEEVSQNFKSATVMGLLRRYNQAMESITHNNFSELTEAKAVIDLVVANDQVATIIFDEFLTDLTINLMNLTACFDPEVILIGGGISANDYVVEKIQEKWEELIIRHFGLNRIKQQGLLTEIKRTDLQNDAGMIGAAYTVRIALKKK
ncbi:ROK family protein [Lactococcus cremoris]|uniref:ROK family protein (Glucokinase) n=1 Tax=Lactococcus lactis subsp. cremoris TaxID=1359 RepID=A0ABR5EFU9_LACLC|nr:ROK family protein [Lactococcus cremoris]KKW71680.1 ROK family protein (glucokinase) [Lactococcus cremoris]MCD6631946.1 ROK family protein [Lactococcus cremoris]TNU82256.1 ROK family protein [Lactococcus cremoris]